MRTRCRATSRDLRQAIDCLPRRTREAMLEGIAQNEIIVGAYANRDGICPMLAAHRAGGRTSVIAFAHAWDRFAFRDTRTRRARRATERELRVLRTYLEASLLDEDAPTAELAAARREHDALVQARRERDASVPGRRERDAPVPGRRERAGDPDRRRELDSSPGWAWTRVVRRYDEYERVLTMVQDAAERVSVSERLPAPDRSRALAR